MELEHVLFAGDAITSTQTINILAQSGTNPLCTAEESFVVTIIATPVIPNPSDVIACQAYTLPALPFGQSYHSVSGGNPATEIPVGVTITTTQTIYIFSESVTTPNCTSEGSFQVTIGTLPTFNTPSDLIQNDPDGTALFDLTTQITSITTDPNYIVEFYSSLLDAQNGTNAIPRSGQSTTTYRLGNAGTVTMSVTGGAITIVSAQPAAGWTLVGSSVPGTHVEVQLSDGTQVLTFSADLVNRAAVAALAAAPSAAAAPAAPAPATQAAPAIAAAPAPRPATPVVVLEQAAAPTRGHDCRHGQAAPHHRHLARHPHHRARAPGRWQR